MHIHVARTPPFRTGFTHTCCQDQTGNVSLTVGPDGGRSHVWDMCFRKFRLLSNTTPRLLADADEFMS